MIHIWDVAIAQRDYLLGDRYDMLRIPKAIIAEVTEKTLGRDADRK